MTDNEIIKALKCCNGWDSRCLNCPLICEGVNCKEKLNSYTLDLINRQKAEIERLKRDIAIHEHVHEESNAAYQVLVKQAKSEAIKEFAERLKDEMRLEDDCQYDCMNCLYECKGYVLIIDNIVKEMTEELE